MEKKGLGRGLDVLLGSTTVREQSDGGGVTLRIAEVEPNADQPRKHFDEVALGELAESIRQHGIITPLLVRRVLNGSYQIIAGERRWRAARMAGLSKVPVVIIDADDRQVAELALIENLQREDLNPIEIAEGYRALLDEYGMTQEDVASRVGRSRPAIANALRLLSLPKNLQQYVTSGELSEGHARAILALSTAKLQEKATKLIIEGQLSVRQTETMVKKWMQETKQRVEELTVNYLEEHQTHLSEQFKRKVKIIAGKQKGRIEIEFYNPDDFEELLETLKNLK